MINRSSSVQTIQFYLKTLFINKYNNNVYYYNNIVNIVIRYNYQVTLFPPGRMPKRNY